MKKLFFLLVPLSLACSKNKQKCYTCVTFSESKTSVNQEETSFSACGWSEDDASSFEQANTSETTSYIQMTTCTEQ